MHRIETKVKQEVLVTCGNYEISALLKTIADEAHDAIIYTNDMSIEQRFLQTECALYRILNILGD